MEPFNLLLQQPLFPLYFFDWFHTLPLKQRFSSHPLAIWATSSTSVTTCVLITPRSVPLDPTLLLSTDSNIQCLPAISIWLTLSYSRVTCPKPSSPLSACKPLPLFPCLVSGTPTQLAPEIRHSDSSLTSLWLYILVHGEFATTIHWINYFSGFSGTGLLRLILISGLEARIRAKALKLRERYTAPCWANFYISCTYLQVAWSALGGCKFPFPVGFKQRWENGCYKIELGDFECWYQLWGLIQRLMSPSYILCLHHFV